MGFDKPIQSWGRSVVASLYQYSLQCNFIFVSIMRWRQFPTAWTRDALWLTLLSRIWWSDSSKLRPQRLCLFLFLSCFDVVTLRIKRSCWRTGQNPIVPFEALDPWKTMECPGNPSIDYRSLNEWSQQDKLSQDKQNHAANLYTHEKWEMNLWVLGCLFMQQ